MPKSALMAEAINGVVLKWAREKQGLSYGDVASRLKCSPKAVEAWEKGKGVPTFQQAETLAYSVYKRPLAVFYLPEPPKEPTLKEEFRVLPEAELESLLADTRFKVRLAHSYSLSLAELNDGRNPADVRIFEQVKLKPDMNLVGAADLVRQSLNISLDRQVAWKDTDAALKGWREAVETAGVYVFKQSFKQKSISGLCLVDKEFPVILINNSTPFTRQIFTLIHELCHILLGVGTVSLLDDWNTAGFDPGAKALEVFCNALAGELLVPASDFGAQAPKGSKADDGLVQRLANRYHVSRETILRRFLDRGLVTPSAYKQRAAEWARQAMRIKKNGGDYYNTQNAYLGEAFLKLVFARHYQGRISLEQAAEHLGVKVKSLPGLEANLFPKGVGALS